MPRKKKENDVSRETYPQYHSYKGSVIGAYCFLEGFCIPVVAYLDEHKEECYIFYNNSPVLATPEAVYTWLDQRAAYLQEKKQEQSKALTIVEKPALYVPPAKKVIQ